MFTDTQAVIFVLCSLVTFASYQWIPSTLEHRKFGSGIVEKIVGGPTFTLFIRWCGVDHLVMGGIMAGHSMGWLPHDPVLGWILCVSAGLVSLISFMSAVAVGANAENKSA